MLFLYSWNIHTLSGMYSESNTEQQQRTVTQKFRIKMFFFPVGEFDDRRSFSWKTAHTRSSTRTGEHVNKNIEETKKSKAMRGRVWKFRMEIKCIFIWDGNKTICGLVLLPNENEISILKRFRLVLAFDTQQPLDCCSRTIIDTL